MMKSEEQGNRLGESTLFYCISQKQWKKGVGFVVLYKQPDSV